MERYTLENPSSEELVKQANQICEKAESLLDSGNEITPDEAYDINDELNTIISIILREGGIMPGIILKASKIYERLAKVYKSQFFHTYYNLRGSGKLQNPIRVSEDHSVTGYICLTSLVTLRHLRGKETNKIRTDLIHLITNVNKEEELGWCYPSQTIESLKAKVPQRGVRKGMIWRLEQLHILAKALRQGDKEAIQTYIPNKAPMLEHARGLENGGLTIFDEVNQDEIKEGKRPVFGSTRPLILRDDPTELSISVLVTTERKRLADAIHGTSQSTLLMGGRSGTQPSEFYK